MDGGGINALRPYMDVCVAYTLGNFRVWSAFSGKEKVESISLGGEWHINSVQVTPSNRQSWISKHSSYLPSFQIPIGKECFDDLDANSLVDFLGKSW